MQKDFILDDHKSLVFEPTNRTPYRNKVIIRNDDSIFHPRLRKVEPRKELVKQLEDGVYDIDEFEGEQEGFEDEEEYVEESNNFEEVEEVQSREDEQEMHYEKKLDLLTDLSSQERSQLYQFPLIRRIVKHQTGKGKVARFSVLTVIGNGKGLVGYGEAKDFETSSAFSKSLVQAFKNLDHVERFEQRTVWTEMSTKLGSTRLVIRPRPVGFGLRCNPYAHQILKAAGIKDASVKVWGSRNPGNVVRALFRILHSGNAPLGMGNGVGGGGKKLEKGVGMRSAFDIERERGRRMVNLR
ncbi:hypothetical protein BDY19DRAFT_955333 [Irpex rosettiformis]|uniref:Uncharacterized protein n=1 Tax=Irpex rosettiformis TaxID=378272 RepID=A0ACB8TZ43_9APHY|nr:hypothetical protein BDY19DRAFT_955333 [Irpex rosettiformis]